MTPRLWLALALFTAAAGIAAAIALPLADRWGRRRPPTARFALMALLLTIGTAGAAAFAFFLHYSLYFASHWEAPFTRIWFLNVAFTGGAAGFFFASLGLRLFVPFGTVALVLAAAWFARRPRQL